MVGSMVGVCGMLFRGASSTAHIPFGPFLAVSAVTYIFAGPRLMEGAFRVFASWQLELHLMIYPGGF
jgi:prepilin signal peptidase PulO-like enzyme (type II secretory pathway)